MDKLWDLSLDVNNCGNYREMWINCGNYREMWIHCGNYREMWIKQCCRAGGAEIGAGAEIIFLINIYNSQFGGC